LLRSAMRVRLSHDGNALKLMNQTVFNDG